MKKLLVVGGLFLSVMFVCKYAKADGSYSPALVQNTTSNQGFLYQVPVSSNPAGILVQQGGAFNWSNSVIGTTTSFTTAQFPGMPSVTLQQIVALTPTASGQLVFCYNCASTPLLISTGTTQNAWVAVSVSSGATTGLGAPK